MRRMGFTYQLYSLVELTMVPTLQKSFANKTRERDVEEGSRDDRRQEQRTCWKIYGCNARSGVASSPLSPAAEDCIP